MYCKKCGKKIDIDSLFCAHCGAKQSNENKPLVEAVKEVPVQPQNIKYDLTYTKEDDALILGIALLTISVGVSIYIQNVGFDNIESYQQFRAFSSLISLILRIFITSWVVNIAKRQNRETFGWGLFAFFLPSIALIVISTRKKLLANIHIIQGLSNQQNSKNLSVKAEEYYQEGKYADSIKLCDKAIELDEHNALAKEILSRTKTALTATIDPGNATQTVLRKTKSGLMLKIVSKNNQTIGADVFIDDKPALDDIYDYESETHRLIVQDGKIKERYFIEKHKNFYVYKKYENVVTVDDLVYSLDGQVVEDGKYSLGFAAGKMQVRDGKVVKFV